MAVGSTSHGRQRAVGVALRDFGPCAFLSSITAPALLRNVARRAGWMLLAVHFSVVANAQQPPRETAPAYSLLRFEEDYRYLRDPARRADAWDVVKYMPLDPDRGSYLTLGGELRERFEYYWRPNFGLQGQSANAYLLNRMLLHADLHAGDYLRTFFVLGGHFAPWKDAAAPPYLDRWDLQQAFLDVRLPLSPLEDIDPVLRVGRQEMVFGSQRLVSIRDAPNVRRAFDGVRLGDTIDGVRVDAFLTRPVLLREGAFDDVSNDAQAFWGLYTTTPVRFLTGTKAVLFRIRQRSRTLRGRRWRRAKADNRGATLWRRRGVGLGLGVALPVRDFCPAGHPGMGPHHRHGLHAHHHGLERPNGSQGRYWQR